MISKKVKDTRKKAKEQNKEPALKNLLLQLEQSYASERQKERDIQPFRVGDHIEVQSTIKKEGKIRTVTFTGHCIAKSNKGLPVSNTIGGLGSSFKVLNLSGEKRILKHFCLHGNVSKVKVLTAYISKRVKRYDLMRNRKISKISLRRDFSVRNYANRKNQIPN